MLNKTSICVPITELDINQMEKSALNALEVGADMLEIRIDYMKNPDPERVKRLVYDLDIPTIVTNRIQSEGGYFTGSEKERSEILIKAGKYSDFIDIELQSNPKYLEMVISSANSTIISYHNFKLTPKLELLLGIVNEEKRLGDIAKFAVMPRNVNDTLTVLEVLSKVENTIGIAMGDIGKYTRIVGPILGAPITYASLNKGSAPGQLDIESTKILLEKLL
ncbi:MAG: type I 3-dehydroquinate dehydratase [Methanomicrobiales archaeon]